MCCISLCVFLWAADVWTHLQFSSGGFHPLLQEFQVTGRALFLLAWLRLTAEAALFDCGRRLDVFTTALASYRSNEIQIGTPSVILTLFKAPQGCNCLVYCCAAKISIQCQRWLRPSRHCCNWGTQFDYLLSFLGYTLKKRMKRSQYWNYNLVSAQFQIYLSQIHINSELMDISRALRMWMDNDFTTGRSQRVARWKVCGSSEPCSVSLWLSEILSFWCSWEGGKKDSSRSCKNVNHCQIFTISCFFPLPGVIRNAHETKMLIRWEEEQGCKQVWAWNAFLLHLFCSFS